MFRIPYEKGICLAGNQNHSFGSWWRSICSTQQTSKIDSLTPKKKGTQKDCDRSHESEAYFFRGAASFEHHFCHGNLSCVMLFSPRMTQRWALSLFFSTDDLIYLPIGMYLRENKGRNLKDQITMPPKTLVLFTRRSEGLKGKGRKTTWHNPKKAKCNKKQAWLSSLLWFYSAPSAPPLQVLQKHSRIGQSKRMPPEAARNRTRSKNTEYRSSDWLTQILLLQRYSCCMLQKQ